MQDSDSSSNRGRRQVVQQLVLFVLGNRKFGVNVSLVREIRGWQPVTEVPSSAPNILGVINLRGSIVGVYDLHARLGASRQSIGQSSVVIVIENDGRSAGFLADAVSDIVSIGPDELKRPSETGSNIDPLLSAMLIRGPDIVSVLDLASLLPAVDEAKAA